MKLTKEQVFTQAWAQYCNGKIGTRQFFDVAWDAAKADSAHVDKPLAGIAHSDHVAVNLAGHETRVQIPEPVAYMWRCLINKHITGDPKEGQIFRDGFWGSMSGWMLTFDFSGAFNKPGFESKPLYAHPGTQSGISSTSSRPNEQNAVQTEQPSLSNHQLKYVQECIERAKLLPVWDNVPHSLHTELDNIFRGVALLSAQRQDGDKEPLDQKWAIWYDGSEGGEPAYCRCNGIELYDYEDEAKHVCTRPAYSPKPVFIYADIANGAPK